MTSASRVYGLFQRGKQMVASVCSGVQRLCWDELLVQFICPVTMQPVPTVAGGPLIIKVPSQTLIFAAKALKYGTIVLKIALSTQGLGGVLPDLSGLVPQGLDAKAFLQEYESRAKDVATEFKDLCAQHGPLAGAVAQLGEDAATDRAQQMQQSFVEMFNDAAESDGTSSMLAIYQLIAEARSKNLESALHDHWQPKDAKNNPWGMTLAKVKGSTKFVWASREGAKRLESEGLAALDPRQDVDREYVKTRTTGMELIEHVAGSAALALAKKVGIPVDKIQSECVAHGISPDAVVAIIENQKFGQILMALVEGNKEQAATLAKGTIREDIAAKTSLSEAQGASLSSVSSPYLMPQLGPCLMTSLSEAQVDGLLQLLLSLEKGDWSALEAVAASSGMALASGIKGKALWEAAKKSKMCKIDGIVRRAEARGLKPEDVENIFVTAADNEVTVYSIFAPTACLVVVDVSHLPLLSSSPRACIVDVSHPSFYPLLGHALSMSLTHPSFLHYLSSGRTCKRTSRAP